VLRFQLERVPSEIILFFITLPIDLNGSCADLHVKDQLPNNTINEKSTAKTGIYYKIRKQHTSIPAPAQPSQ
jgi:hypothetical protein